MDLIGYGLATLALVFFGLYMVPRKLTGLRDLPFVLSMSVGVVLTTALICLLLFRTPLRDHLLPRGECPPVREMLLLGLAVGVAGVVLLGVARL